MKELIDSENGVGFSENVDLSGYNFFKNDSFVSFKIRKIDGVNVVIVKYIYSDKYKDLLSILSFCSNFWIGKNAKIIYYQEREKHPYVVSKLEELGFEIRKYETKKKYKYEFTPKIKKNKDMSKEWIVEAFV